MLGFSTSNPADDLKASGVLGLENIVLFVENFPAEAKMMMRTNTRNSNSILATYPFIKSAMAICRVLCEALHLIDEEGLKGKEERSKPYCSILFCFFHQNYECDR